MLAMDLPNTEIVQEISIKQQLAGQLIRLNLIDAEYFEQIIQMFAQSAIAQNGKEANLEEVVAKIKEKTKSNAFVYAYTAPLENVFDEGELNTLKSYLSSDVMQKFQRKSIEINAPVMAGLQGVIAEILEPYSSKVESDSKDGLLSITLENFHTEVENSSIPVVLDCYATWCGPCKAMDPILLELSKAYEGKIKFVKLDVDAQSKLAKQLGVSAMPTFMIYKNGGTVAQQVGGMEKEAFENWIKERMNCSEFPKTGL